MKSTATRSPIQSLDPKVIDQIAAGEVVDRPAHLVKELVENALDAGATQIEVDFEQGGRKVVVQDNGSGIPKEDLSLALARHATSKISMAEDLWNLHSFGFRGEALASIAAVTQLTLSSRQPHSPTAYQIDSVYGDVSDVAEVSGKFGTKILINGLFENVPARLKFLKSEVAESTQIKQVLKALALAHPQCEWRIRSGGKTLFHWPVQSSEERIKSILEVDELYTGDYESDGKKVTAYYAPPHLVAKTSKNIWIFVQDRWVQDRSLQAAVMDSFQNLLMHGEFPYAVVKVQWARDEVDVNIHPTKSQVKFRDASEAFRFVRRAFRQSIEKGPWITQRAVELDRKVAPVFQEASPKQNLSLADDAFYKTQYQQKPDWKSLLTPYEKTVEANLSSQNQDGKSFAQEHGQSISHGHASNPQKAPHQTQAISQYHTQGLTGFQSRTQDQTPGEGVAKTTYWSRLQVLGQADLTYIITQSSQGLVFVDQHAAHERVTFERLVAKWKTGGIEVQPYLIPFRMTLEPDEVEALIKAQDQWKQLGFEIEQTGVQDIEIVSAPVGIKEKAIQKVIAQFAQQLVESHGSLKLESRMMDMAATLACHSSVRAGQSLSIQEMQELLSQMDEFPLSSFCPHGRPVSVEYAFQKLEKDFGRIV